MVVVMERNACVFPGVALQHIHTRLAHLHTQAAAFVSFSSYYDFRRREGAYKRICAQNVSELLDDDLLSLSAAFLRERGLRRLSAEQLT